MPRSFLVKKHLSNKKPNYGALDFKSKEVPPSPKTRPAFYPPPSEGEERCLLFDSRSSLISSQWIPTSTPSSLTLPVLEYCPRTATEPYGPTELCGTPEHLSGTPTGCCKATERRLGSLMERCGTTDNYPGTPTEHLSFFPPRSPPSLPSAADKKCLDCHMTYSPFSGLAPCHQLNSDWPRPARSRQLNSDWPRPASSHPLHSDWPCRRYFSCKLCDKEYVSLGALKMHIRTHTLPCVCKLCGKAFSRPWLLQGHIRTHTGEKPFSCPHCSRAFADRSNLRAHLQTHSEVKRYQCSSCSKTFSRISLLTKHHQAGCSSL